MMLYNCLKFNVVINVEISVTMAVVGVSLFINQIIDVALIKMNAMIEFMSFIVVGVMAFVERPASTSAMISHRTKPLTHIEIG